MPEIRNQDFSQGWNTYVPPHLLPEGATPTIQNCDLSETVGALIKRKGQSIEFTELTVAANPSVAGLYQYIQADNDKFIVGAANDDVYNITGAGTWTSIFTNASLNGTEVNFATFGDLLIFVNPNITTQKWTGAGASANLLGTPPSNVKYVEIHKNRVWMANSSAGKSRLHYSSAANAEDWTTTGDLGAGFLDISPDDGDQITGLASIGTILLVFKNLSIHAIYGHKPSNFIQKKITSAAGCVANRTIVKTERFALFLSERGVYACNIEYPATLMSLAIKETVAGLTNTVKTGAAAGHYRNQYWLCIDTDADGKNDEAYVLDYVSGIWFRYTNIKGKVFLTKDDGTLLSGGSDKVIVREHNDTSDDESTAITMSWDSKAYDFGEEGSFIADKQGHDLFVFCEAMTGGTLTVDRIINGRVLADPITFTLDAAVSGEDRVYKNSNVPDTDNGRHFQLRISNAQAAKRPKVFGYSMEAEIKERAS